MESDSKERNVDDTRGSRDPGEGEGGSRDRSDSRTVDVPESSSEKLPEVPASPPPNGSDMADAASSEMGLARTDGDGQSVSGEPASELGPALATEMVPDVPGAGGDEEQCGKDKLEVPGDRTAEGGRRRKQQLLRPAGRSVRDGTFVIFDRSSYLNIKARLAQAARDYGFIPHRVPTIADGDVLPKNFEPVPEHVYGKPVEEFDGVSFDKTFCVISKRFSNNYVNRFSATRAFFIFSPWNPLRRLALFVSTNQYFDYVVILTILVNCVFLAQSNSVEEAEYVFLSIYTTEMTIKAIAKGFIINRYTYLRSPWNWLDFAVIILGFVTIFVELGNLSGLRTFRVLRALKTVSILPGLKMIVNALLHSISMLTEVMALTIFCLMVFALFGLQIFMGVLRNKCMKNMEENSSVAYLSYMWDENNWLREEDSDFQSCGNVSGGWHCPENYTCLSDFGDNPNFGYTNFDNFGWSMLTTFQLITLDFWEDVYNRIIATCGPSSIVFFIFVVFFGSFYLINLMLAVVAMSYEEEVVQSKSEIIELEVITNSKKQSSNGRITSPSTRKTILTRRGRITVTSRKNSRNSNIASIKNNSKESKNSVSALGSVEIDKKDSVTNSPSVIRKVEFAVDKAVIPNGAVPANPLEMVSPHEIVQRTFDGVRNEKNAADLEINGDHAANTNIGNGRQYDVNERQLDPGKPEIVNIPGEVPTDSQNNIREKELISGGDPTWHNGSLPILTRLELNDNLDVALVNQTKANDVSQSMLTIPKDNISTTGSPNSSATRVIVIKEKVYLDRNCACCQMCCCNYQYWLSFQNALCAVVRDPFFELLITVCIILNTVFLAIEHHGMSQGLRYVLNVGNKIFTVVFTLEAVLKLLALSREYFRNGWNIFDLIAVVGSLIDLSFENFNGLSVLRALRLLRVFKLAQSWTTMKILLSIILSTIGALGNLTLVLIIIMYIFAVLGMQLFGSNYKPQNFYPDEVPRWNFKDFPHSFLMIFRVLCGEWIEPMWDCMRSSGNGSGQACIALFLPALIVGNFLVLNLFLALLLSSFNSDQLSKGGKKDEEIKRLAKGLRRLKNCLLCFCCRKKRNAISPLSTTASDGWDLSASSSSLSESLRKTSDSRLKDELRRRSSDGSSSSDSKSVVWAPVATYVDHLVRGSPNGSDTQNGLIDMSDLREPSIVGTTAESSGNGHRHRRHHHHHHPPSSHSSTGPSVVVTTTDGQPTPAAQDEICPPDDDDEDEEVPIEERWPEDCFPESCYKRCPCCAFLLTTYASKAWFVFRKSALLIVDHPSFEWVILVFILASSVSLCFEDIYLESNKPLQIALYYLNILFTVLFTLEMVLKWLAHGLVVYFTNVWTILDFIIVLVAVFSLVVENSANLTALRSMRTLRALRPLRAISKWQGMKIVVNALVSSIPSIVNVLLVCIVFWLVFSIMGVQFFAGRFYKCLDENKTRLDVTEVQNKTECLNKNYSWVNSNVNFDHVGQGYLALFQVATFEGWMEIMADAVDAREVDEQPIAEANMLAYIYFIIFIVCGSFFTLNLFIGVIIDNFNKLKKQYEGGVLDMFLTDSQKNYYAAMKKLGRKKPQKLIRRPKTRVQIFFYNMCMSRKFELVVFIVILLNMLSMGIEHYGQKAEVVMTLEIINVVFTTLFAIECLIKILAFRHYYFVVPWNIFDFVLVVSSILGILLKDLLTGLLISPTLLRVIRVFRIGRVLRLIKAAKGIRKLVFALMVSLPALFNIGALLFLIMFIYAIMGMSLFGYIKHEGVINEMINFETFGSSMLLLFRLITSAGWSDILGPLMISPPDCDVNFRRMPNGDCGNPTFAVIFLVSYIILNFMIVINMYIAVILENFNQAHQEEELGIVEDDIEMFYVNWANYDPQATQFIPLPKLPDFIDSLDPPLRVPKPNIIALVSFDVPIARGNKVHCLDILHALIKRTLGHVDETAEFQKIRSQMEDKFNKQFPTRKRLEIVSSTMRWKREDLAARTLQRAYRRWKYDGTDAGAGGQHVVRGIQTTVRGRAEVAGGSRNGTRRGTSLRKLSNFLRRRSSQSQAPPVSPKVVVTPVIQSKQPVSGERPITESCQSKTNVGDEERGDSPSANRSNTSVCYIEQEREVVRF